MSVRPRFTIHGMRGDEATKIEGHVAKRSLYLEIEDPDPLGGAVAAIVLSPDKARELAAALIAAFEGEP